MSEMFCFQCQQTAGGSGCVRTGVCGKQPETANLQDALVCRLIRLAEVCEERGEHPGEVTRLLADGLFTTLTNVNFDSGAIRAFTERVEAWLRQWEAPVPEEDSGWLWRGETDMVSLRATLLKYDFSGSAVPKVYGGFNINLSYKAFDLSTVFSYSLGGKVLDSSYRGLMDVGEFGYAMSPDLHNAWTTPGQITDVPRLDNNSGHATSIGQSYSTRWLTNANYLNLRTVTLAYNLPKSILNVINIKSARVNVSAENLFMLKARQGLNPQANYAGVSYNEYMPAKNFTIGLNVSF